MKRICALLSLVALFALATTSLAGRKEIRGRSGEYQLEKFVHTKLSSGQEWCGPYFVLAGFTGGQEKFIFFAYSDGEKLVTDKVTRDMVVVKIDKNRKQPTFSSVLVEGPASYSVSKGVLFRISPRDYVSSSCLASSDGLK